MSILQSLPLYLIHDPKEQSSYTIIEPQARPTVDARDGIICHLP